MNHPSVLMRVALTLHVLALLSAPPLAASDDVEERTDIRFWIDARDITRPSCGGCSRPTWLHIGFYELSLYAPAGLRFERFDVEGAGQITLHGVSPNGRTVRATLRPGGELGDHRVTAIFRSRRGKLATRTQRYQVEQRPRERDCVPSPCADPVRVPDDGRHMQSPPAPPIACVLPSRGPLRFFRWDRTRAVHGPWPLQLRFTVALRDDERGALTPSSDAGTTTAALPEVNCTTGRVLSVKELPALPGTRERFDVEVASVPEGAEARLVGGEHRCTVVYTLHDDGQVRRRTGSFGFRIDGDGQLSTSQPRCPEPSPKVPQEGAQPPPAPAPGGLDDARHLTRTKENVKSR